MYVRLRGPQILVYFQYVVHFLGVTQLPNDLTWRDCKKRIFDGRNYSVTRSPIIILGLLMGYYLELVGVMKL